MLSIYYFSYVHLKILRLIKKDSNKKKIEKKKPKDPKISTNISHILYFPLITLS